MALHGVLSIEERLNRVAGKASTPKPPPEPVRLKRGRPPGGPSLARDRRASKRKRFLEAYAEQGNLGYACEQAGVSRTAIYNWLEHDERFALEYRQAELRSVERLEEEAHRRAVTGVDHKRTVYYHGQPVGVETRTEWSDQLLTLMLRARHPERYRETLGLNVSQVIKSIQGFDAGEVLGTAGVLVSPSPKT